MPNLEETDRAQAQARFDATVAFHNGIKNYAIATLALMLLTLLTSLTGLSRMSMHDARIEALERHVSACYTCKP